MKRSPRRIFMILNDGLFNSAKNANTYANILMPVMANLGNINYVLTLGVGSILAITGIGGLTLGGLASFLQLTRSFQYADHAGVSAVQLYYYGDWPVQSVCLICWMSRKR